MFELRNVTKRFGSEYALRGVSMEIGGGLSFITGTSGSGKTTLLRIISGMERNYEGAVLFRGTDLRELTGGKQSWLCGDVFGFVWQDFNLLEDRTVLENVLLPRYLKEEPGEKRAMSLLRELRIDALADQKVAKLSGGQKQRVAIARELMKDPQVILADEPTSALDQTASKEILNILRTLSKRRAVVVVTHDTSLIREGDAVYALDKGELDAAPAPGAKTSAALPAQRKRRLTPRGAFALAGTALRRQMGRTAASVFSLLLAAVLLLVPLSGAVGDSGSDAFDQLFATYGESLLDISLYSSFMSAGSSGGGEPDGPKADVSQDLDGLFERYREDPRVEHVLFAQAVDNIQIGLDGQSYTVEQTNNSPVFRRLVAGKMPMGDGAEIAVPETFADSLGLAAEELLGKELAFSGTVFNWATGQPVETPVSCTATIVGVVDTTMVYEHEGTVYETPMTDSFFFSPAALTAMREEAGLTAQPGNFYIRCKTPADVISVKDELNAMGIVPLGRFELIEDMVRLQQQTTRQSGAAMWVVGALALVVALAAALITAALRRREFAIEKVSGFGPGHLAGMLLAEALLQGGAAAVLLLLTAPVLTLGTQALWEVSLLSPALLAWGVGLCAGLGLLSWAITALTAAAARPQLCLRTGDR